MGNGTGHFLENVLRSLERRLGRQIGGRIVCGGIGRRVDLCQDAGKGRRAGQVSGPGKGSCLRAFCAWWSKPVRKRQVRRLWEARTSVLLTFWFRPRWVRRGGAR